MTKSTHGNLLLYRNTMPGRAYYPGHFHAVSYFNYNPSCHSNGSLTLILMPISRHTQNINKSPSHLASLTVWTSPPAASKARVSVTGNITFITSAQAEASGVRDCYLERHRDARWWLPDVPDAPHTVSHLIL